MDRTSIDNDGSRCAAEPHGPFTWLPPRITPEQMIEVQPVVHAVSVLHPGTETEWLIRTGGGG